MNADRLFAESSLFSRFNAIMDFPEGMRPLVLEALETAAEHSLPSAEEVALVGRRRKGVRSLDSTWQGASNHFASLIDPNFASQPRHKPSRETVIRKVQFFNMINNLTSEQVAAAVREIRQKGIIPQ